MKNIENLNTGSTSRKIAQNVFIGFAGFNGVIAGLLGVMTLVNMPAIFASLGVIYLGQTHQVELAVP